MTAQRTTRALLCALLVAAVVVVASGLVLSFVYLPKTAHDHGLSDSMRSVHRIGGDIVLVLTVLLVVVAVIRAGARGTSAAVFAVLGGVLAVAGIAIAIARGARLAWDQLALRAVTVGDHGIDGVWMRGNVKYVLRGIAEISVGGYRREVWIHVLVAPLLTAVGIAVVLLAMRNGPTGPTGPTGPAVDQTAASGSATNVTSASS